MLKRVAKYILGLSLILPLLLPAQPAAAAGANLKDQANFTFSAYKMDVGESVTLVISPAQEMSQFNVLDLEPVSSDESVLQVESTDYFKYKITGLSEGTADIVFTYPGYDELRFTLTVGTSQEEKDYWAYKQQFEKVAQYDDVAMTYYAKYQLVTTSTRKQAYYAYDKVIVPNVTQALAQSKKIKTDNPELATLHQDYIKGMKTKLDAVILFKKALAPSSPAKFSFVSANNKIKESNKYITLHLQEVKAYLKKYGIQDDTLSD
ncbi:hypothetical protein KIH86_15555 [Paenibacillus sp. HN-1]|uniref:hypothetical protein n=1 Tax=Paenibacillus TaxID=44249 RepID=UPI001CA7CE35|nr:MULTISPECIES: hypothetical protein [Paenibacillus]MBY9077310.1 hypothetical protein [Paenibacillus sp. CGMCC 1.18879]MBY9085630.1 hypothetical protein [Paenibacillus sinensis]